MFPFGFPGEGKEWPKPTTEPSDQVNVILVLESDKRTLKQ